MSELSQDSVTQMRSGEWRREIVVSCRRGEKTCARGGVSRGGIGRVSGVGSRGGF